MPSYPFNAFPPWITSPPFVTSANGGGLQYGEYALNNGVYNPGAGTAQTMTVYDQGQWSVLSTQPSGGGVRAYPAVSYSPGWPVSAYTSITSTFAESFGAGAVGNAAYDIAMNSTFTSPISSTLEVMIWTEAHSDVPAGSIIDTPVIDGRAWSLYFSATLQAWPYYAFYPSQQFTQGTVNILAFLNYMVANGHMTANYLINTIWFGFEIGTATSALFSVNAYSVSVQGGAGGPQW